MLYLSSYLCTSCCRRAGSLGHSRTCSCRVCWRNCMCTSDIRRYLRMRSAYHAISLHTSKKNLFFEFNC